MALLIRQADLDTDHNLLIGLLQRYVNPVYDRERFDWAYRHNPFGEGRAWIAFSGTGDEVVGMAAAFPRRLLVDGRPESAWLLADFCITDKYRSLGPAVQLQRACLDDAGRGGIRFYYDAPSEGMMSVYARLGVSSSQRMVRLARPLKVNGHLERWIKSPAARKVLAPAANAVLSLDTRLPRLRDDVSIQLHEGACGLEFTDLAREVGSAPGIHVDRTANYVTWRYLRTPMRRHELLTARRGGALRGYLAFSAGGDGAMIADLFVAEGPAVAGALLRGLLEALRRRDISTVSAPMLETHPCRRVFESHGFRPRETTPIVICTAPGADMPWALTYGDLDG